MLDGGKIIDKNIRYKNVGMILQLITLSNNKNNSFLIIKRSITIVYSKEFTYHINA